MGGCLLASELNLQDQVLGHHLPSQRLSQPTGLAHLLLVLHAPPHHKIKIYLKETLLLLRQNLILLGNVPNQTLTHLIQIPSARKKCPSQSH
jgi:hypothetical protein